MTPLIQITADEVNHIVYAYLNDSGFFHTAFSLRAEGRLEQSTHFNDHIPRGELVELLTKALLYTEVETHCKGDGLITDCKTSFSLLKKHVCTVEVDDNIDEASKQPGQVNGLADSQLKRKANIPADGDDRPRRVKRSLEPEAPEQSSGSAASKDRLQTPVSVREVSPMSGILPPGRVNGDVQKKLKADDMEEDRLPSSSKAVKLLSGHEGEVFMCLWNPKQQRLLASGSKDATVRIWDLPFSPDDNDAEASNPPIVLDHLPPSESQDITAIDWNSEGTLIATGSYDSVLRIWTARGDFYMSHPQHQGPIFATKFSESGRWLLTSSLDGTACVWDVKEKKLFMQFRCHAECCLDVDWLNDYAFASAGADKVVHIMQLGNPDPLRTYTGHTDEINQIKFNPSKTLLASCSDDHTVRIWKILPVPPPSESAEPPPRTIHNGAMFTLGGHTDSVNGICWCPDRPADTHDILSTFSLDGTVRLWDASNGDCLRCISDHQRVAYALSYCPGGKYFATGSGDGWLHIYNVETGHKIWSWNAGKDKPGIYSIEWQKTAKFNRLALSLENHSVGVIDVTRIPDLAMALI